MTIAGTGLGLGGASLVAGIALLITSSARGDRVDELTAEIRADPATPTENPCGGGPVTVPQCSELSDADSEQVTFRGAGIALTAIGGVLAIGSVIYLVAVPSGDGEQQDAVAVLPMVGPRLSGLLLSGRF